MKRTLQDTTTATGDGNDTKRTRVESEGGIAAANAAPAAEPEAADAAVDASGDTPMEAGTAAYTRPPSVREDEVGICGRINESVFRPCCTLKGRYTDFVVREVSATGAVARLSNLDVPQAMVPAAQPAAQAGPPPTSAESLAALRAFIDGEEGCTEADFATDSLEANLVEEEGALPEGCAITLTKRDFPKELRGKVHGLVRSSFPKLVSSTNGDGLIVLQRATAEDQARVKGAAKGGKGGKGGKGARGGRRRNDTERYIHFTVYKENLETSAVTRMLAYKLGLRAQAIGYSGTKDKRAVTAQRMSTTKVDPKLLAKLNSGSFGRGICKVGDFEYAKEELKLGMHSGNRFSIVLRDCAEPPAASGGDSTAVSDFSAFTEKLKDTFAKVQANGFINYYGLQRFGSTSIPTFLVAQEIMKGDYVEAINVMLKTKAEIVPEFKAAAAIWMSDPAKAVDITPKFCPTEREFLGRVSRLEGGFQQDDIRALFEQVYPRPSRSLYFHALQSRVWNEMATIRMSKLPHHPVVGDLVLSATQNPNAKLQQVCRVTQADVDSGKYAMTDVVLPLPGCDALLEYPDTEHLNKAAYTEVLRRFDALELLGGEKYKDRSQQNFDPRQLNTFGDYRCIAHRPGDLSWSVTRYEDKDVDLQHLEFDHAKGECDLDPERALAGFAEPEPCLEGGRVAIRCSFTLPTSCYATTFLREAFSLTTAAL